MNTRNQQRDINKIINKYPDSCSICKTYFDDEYLTYTVFGYDKINRIQVVSDCCLSKISRPILLGLSGFYDPNEINELMKDHPLANTFFKNKANGV